ncbi:hypothetical protein N9973_01310, partial [bacterium]|nr:hypothetical protein [bacterium]
IRSRRDGRKTTAVGGNTMSRMVIRHDEENVRLGVVGASVMICKDGEARNEREKKWPHHVV